MPDVRSAAARAVHTRAVVRVATILEERSDKTSPRPKTRFAVWRLALLGWAVGLAVTVSILVTPFFVFGVRSPSLHLVLDSVDACVALLVAYLVHGRFVRRGRLQDLLISQGLVLLAVAGLGLGYVADAFPGFAPGTLDVWLPLTVRVLGAIFIVSGALTGNSTTPRWLGALRRWPAIPVVAVVVVVLSVLWALRTHLPVALNLSALPESARSPFLTGHVLLLGAQAFAAACFMLASVVYTAQASRYHDELLRWLGPACALAGFARVNYLLFPSLYTDWLYTGDVLRTGCYLLLLVGATREIRQYWTTQAEVAVLADRHRLARELHDGVIQELGYIRSESCALPAAASAQSDHILGACDRALDEARSAVQALSHTGEDSLAMTLHRAAQQVTDRFGTALDVELDDTIVATFEQRHALVRIAREAASNAIRHGGAQRITVSLTQHDGQRQLRVRDDGAGFDVAATARTTTGYGLTSMRDRAKGLPGSFDITSAPGEGSVVTLTW